MPIYALDEIEPELPPPGRYWVAPDAVLIGRVRLDDEASVWWTAVLRGDNELIHIGARSNIQEGAMLHTDMGFPLSVGSDCTIGHHAILHGCTIAANSLIGMGATLLNGVRIGRNCLVGANALVPEGKEFPDNSLIVGAPARVVRTLDDEAAKRIGRSSAGYVARWRLFAARLRRIEVAPGG